MLDELIKGAMTPEHAQELMLALDKAVIERIMGAEMNEHLGYPPESSKPSEQTNERNGSSGKTVLTDRGVVRIDVPRDRNGSFEPILIPKLRGFDERVVAMYARGIERARDPGVHRRALRHAGLATTARRSRPTSSARSPTR